MSRFKMIYHYFARENLALNWNIKINHIVDRLTTTTYPQVCKYFLVKFCPHDLFTNTKADLGPCKFSTHDVKIRETLVI